MKDNRWVEKVRDETATEVDDIDSSISFLRGADFADLVAAHEFGVTVGESEVSFAQRVDGTLNTQLARDLVNGGYIDRNFALYAAQFYGDFTGVDVATFIVQNVQTNTMELDYQFDGPASIANLLEESRDSDFLSTDAAFNIQVLDFLLVRHGTGGNAVVDHLIADPGDQVHEFLAAYFTSSEERGRLADALSRRKWLGVFTYLVADEGVPDDVRADLVNAALLATSPEVDYEFGTDVAEFVVANYKAMSAFTKPQNEVTLHRIVDILEGAEVSLPELGALDGGLRRLVVDRDMYELTAGNLRTALDLGADDPIALDKVRENDVVYEYCLANPEAYLRAATRDPKTPHVLLTPEALAGVLTDIDNLDEDEAWEADSVSTLLEAASSDSVLTRLQDAPASTWRALAAAKLFRASLTNLEAYRAELGGIDEPLGELLVTAGAIETSVDSDPVPLDTDDISVVKVAAAVALLNASAGIPSPEDRVQLADSLELEEHLPAGTITAEPSNLFALLIEADLVPDDAATFSHLHAGGWRAVEPAILASSIVATFLQPDHIDGIVADVFKTPDTADKVGARVLSSLAAFQPTDDAAALKAAGKFAVATGTALPVDQIDRIATALHDAGLTVGLLRIAEPAAGETVTILGRLGGKYTYLTTWEKDEFDVPVDENYRAVFKALENAGVCQIHRKQKNLKPHLLVKRP